MFCLCKNHTNGTSMLTFYKASTFVWIVWYLIGIEWINYLKKKYLDPFFGCLTSTYSFTSHKLYFLRGYLLKLQFYINDDLIAQRGCVWGPRCLWRKRSNSNLDETASLEEEERFLKNIFFPFLTLTSHGLWN